MKKLCLCFLAGILLVGCTPSKQIETEPTPATTTNSNTGGHHPDDHPHNNHH